MSFANPLGLWALLAIPAIVAIHFFQRRFPPLRVASLHLWGLESNLKESGRNVNRLPVTGSLLLELSAALLIAILLSQPRFESLRTATHLVVVLDNSASMQSKPEGQESIRDLAKTFLQERIEEISGRCVVTIVTSGRRPVTLAGPAVEWEEAKKQLADWSPSEPMHDFEPAWDLAAQIAGRTGQLLFITDRMPEKSDITPTNMEIVALGSPCDNLAIVHASWEKLDDSNKEIIFFNIRNFADRSNHVTATIRDSNRQTVFQKELEIAAQKEVSVNAKLEDGIRFVSISLDGEFDSLALDSEISLVEPRRRTLKVAVAFAAGHPAVGPIRRAINALDDVVISDVATSHLVIGPASLEPQLSREQWWLGIGPIDENAEKKRNARTPSSTFPFMIERNHPLVQDLRLNGVRWGGVQDLARNVTPLVSCGGTPIFYRLNDVSFTAYTMNIDLKRSNLTQSEDWPIFFQNFIEERKKELPGFSRWNYLIGQPIRLSRPPFDSTDEPQRLTLRYDGQSKDLIDRDTIDLPLPIAPTLGVIKEGDTILERFAVNFIDSRESSLIHLEKGHRIAQGESLESLFKLDRPYSWVILLLVGILMLAVFANWFILRKRSIRSIGNGIGRQFS